jgi:hypothetical protein
VAAFKITLLAVSDISSVIKSFGIGNSIAILQRISE